MTEKEDIKKDCVEQIQKLMDFHCLDSIDRLIIFTRLQNLYTTEAEIAKLVGVTRQAISKRVRKLERKNTFDVSNSARWWYC